MAGGATVMSTADPWPVELSIREDQDQAHAGARLLMDGGAHMLGHGTVRCHPREPNVTKIGEQIAVARLSDVAHPLPGSAAAELGDITHERPGCTCDSGAFPGMRDSRPTPVSRTFGPAAGEDARRNIDLVEPRGKEDGDARRNRR
jgi:Rv2632c-like